MQSYKVAAEIGEGRQVAEALLQVGGAYLRLVTDTVKHPSTINIFYEEARYMPVVDIPAGRQARLYKAIGYLHRSADSAKKIGVPLIVQDCYEQLAKAYQLTGNYKKALEYANALRLVKDSLFSADNNNKIAALESKRKEFQDSLKDAVKIKERQVLEQNHSNYVYASVAVVVLLLGFTFFLTRNNKLLSKERKKSDNLLLNILPEEVAMQLKEKGSATAKQFDNVTVLFSDFVDFTKASQHMSPQVLVEELDTCFKKFDEIVSKHNIEKIKTIGDAYLACAGLPTTDTMHAQHAVQAAIEINKFMDERYAKLGTRTFQVRLGLHSGSVVAGIVGNIKFAYDIWGDTVNTAARMEQNSEPGKVNISETTYELVKDKFGCEYRGEIDAKGKGQLKMYYVK